MEKINRYLLDRGGRCIATVEKPNGGAVHFWLCDQRVLIVDEHEDGWEVYCPASGSTRVDETLKALTTYLDA